MEAKTQNQLDDYFSVKKVSEKLEVSEGTVYNLIKRGVFRKVKLTDDITRLRGSEVQAYCDNRTR